LLSLIHVVEWRASVTGDQIALSDHLGGELSYAGLAAQTERSAARFAAAGITPGDVVPILARNQVGWVTAMLGLIRLGALPAAVNWRLSAPEVTGLLRLMQAGARLPAIITDVDCEQLAKQAVADAGAPALLRLEGQQDSPLTVDRPAGRLRGPETCLLVHTSGTTGLPKLVPLTHEMLVSAATFMKLEVP
jgi:acyl-CoA synthetase (AMP-forming)/AMP-acid ligase II